VSVNAEYCGASFFPAMGWPGPADFSIDGRSRMLARLWAAILAVRYNM
jgi:hypothetical protein